MGIQIKIITMGTGIKAIYRWRCMPTATPRTAGSTKDASLDGCGGDLR